MNKIIKNISLSAVALSLIISPFTVSAQEPTDIVDTAAGAGLSTLVSFVQTSDSELGTELEDTLRNAQGITVFAPTNKAFDSLPRIVNRALEKDPSLLPKILTYHVVGSKIESGDIPRFTRVETLQGDDLFARKFNNGKVRINLSNVVTADVFVDANDSVVHVIDRVLIPWREVFKSLRK
jgi:uncharacterized surface protein with fasciclin (FAS1) repeats